MFADLAPPYGAVVVDPPWNYPTTGTGTSTRGVNPPSNRPASLHAELPYSAMSLAQIKALPVSDLVTDGRCFLWVTNRYLRHGWDVLEAWGFDVQERVLVWCKTPRATTPVTTEFILMGRKGRPTKMPWCGTTWFQWPRHGGHSVKPQAFLDLVEMWCPGPYVELFARAPRLGWDSWGHGYEVAS